MGHGFLNVRRVGFSVTRRVKLKHLPTVNNVPTYKGGNVSKRLHSSLFVGEGGKGKGGMGKGEVGRGCEM